MRYEYIDTTARLAAIVGERYVLRRPSELRVYDSDGLPGYHRQPSLAVLPTSIRVTGSELEDPLQRSTTRGSSSVDEGTPSEGGHANHLRVINEIRRYGSIAAAVPEVHQTGPANPSRTRAGR